MGVAASTDRRVEEKDLKKGKNYNDLQIEVKCLWQEKAKEVPIIAGSLGVIPKTTGALLELNWH